MGKCLGFICALMLSAIAARGQDRTQALHLGHSLELSGGYTFTRFHLGVPATSMNGAYGAFGIKLTPWMQFSADASVEYGQFGIAHLRIYGNHFGPRFFLRRPNPFHATPFAEVLVGGSRLDGTVNGPGGFTFADNGFSMKAGGGVDFDLSPRLAVRAINLDYYMTPFLGERQNNLWLATGIVFRFGAGWP
ncbi:MAG TPA: hypothetical protein VGT03_08995 [Candidatus Acidoferrales bacterium]|nr:hypothetical protein [Candidatus Acidoferrales bacterium]